VEEQSLVHVPLYPVKYNYQGKSYTVMVEAAAGGVFSNIYPAKAEAPYLAVGLITALVFLCLSSIPVIYSANGGQNDAWIGLGICSGIGVVVAPLLFALAAWVAAKV
jgi:hypothetical protein